MSDTIWTPEMENAFQQTRKARGGEPFADAAAEAAYQAAKRRRYHATPSAEMLDLQLREQRGAAN